MSGRYSVRLLAVAAMAIVACGPDARAPGEGRSEPSAPAERAAPALLEAPGYSAAEAARLRAEIDIVNWDDGGERSRFAYTHPAAIFPAAIIERRGPVSDLAYELDPRVGEYRFERDGAETTLQELVTDSFIDGFIVLHRGRIAYEAYPRMRQHDRHQLFSVTKAFVGTLVGLLEEDGEVDITRGVETYLPRLQGTAWAGISVRDVLEMASGMEQTEAEGRPFEDPAHKHYQLEASLGWLPRTDELPESVLQGDTYGFLASLERVEEPGTAFRYTSSNSAVLGWLVEEVTGKPLADVLSERIWSHIGAEADGLLLLNERGIPIAHGGMATTLRDLARAGLLFTESWNVVSDERVISESYLGRIQQVGRPELLDALPEAFRSETLSHVAYHWDGVLASGAFYKGGFAGQLLVVFPRQDVVIAYFGTNAELGPEPPPLPLRALVDALF